MINRNRSSIAPGSAGKGRTTVLKHLARPAYTPADIERIGALVAAMTAAALDYAPIEIPGENS